MPITVDEPSTVCSEERPRRWFAGLGRSLRWSARLKRYETWLILCFVYVPVVPLFSAAILGGYLYVRSHRTVYLVNGLPIDIVVDVDGRHSIALGPHAQARLAMAEGSHSAVVSTPQLGFEPVNFRIGGQGSSGLLRAPTFIVDPTRSAILVWEEAPVSASSDRREAESRAHLGEAFLAYPHIDYAFEEFPKHSDANFSAATRRTRISLVAAPAEKLVQAILTADDRAGDTLGLIENHLRAAPDDVSLLSGYWAIARRRHEVERCRKFLAARLADRPVRVDWHRLYQTLSEDSGEGAALVDQYGGWVAADPQNSALLYLRGRCEPDREAALRFYQRAIAADPENAYPRYAESGILLSRGQFEKAAAAARIACRLRPDSAPMKRQLTKARMAVGQYDELEAEQRAALLDRPSASDDQERLLAVLVAANKLDQARHAVKTLCQRAAETAQDAERACTDHLNHLLLYFEGDFEGLLAATEQQADTGDSALPRYQALFELQRQVKPPAGLRPIPADHEGYSLLCQALAWAERGDQAEAAEARRQAIKQFRAGRYDDRRAADILAKGDQWSDQDIDGLPLDPTHKCILLSAIAEVSGDRAGALLDLAEKLNFERRFPYHFLKRTIQRLRRQAEPARSKR